MSKFAVGDRIRIHEGGPVREIESIVREELTDTLYEIKDTQGLRCWGSFMIPVDDKSAFIEASKRLVKESLERIYASSEEYPEPVIANEEPGFFYGNYVWNSKTGAYDKIQTSASNIPYEEPKKYNIGKPRTDLISGEFTLALGEALSYGADKYDEKKGETPNYLKGDGFLYSELIGALERHLARFKKGTNVDDESNLEHIIQVAVNAMFLYNYRISGKGVDDRIILKNDKEG